jgi:hypothetical protein
LQKLIFIITNDLAAKIGGRFEHSSIISAGKHSAAHFLLLIKLVKADKYPQLTVSSIKNQSTRELAYTTALGYTKATHYIINYQKNTNDRIFRIEGFYKQYEDLVKSHPDKLLLQYVQQRRQWLCQRI